MNLVERIDSLIALKMNQYQIPGLAIGVIRNDTVVLTKGYGARSIKAPPLVTEQSVFHTASISKLFTAQAIAQLIAEGQMSLDDKLVAWIPELSYKDPRVTTITIKQLLNSTSGLPDVHNYHWSNNHQADNSLEEYVLGLNLQLDADPGSAYSYSNLGYNLLGYVIEKCTSLTFEDYLQTNILEKYGMQQSDFRAFQIPDSLRTSPHSKKRLNGRIYERSVYPYTREHAPSSTLNASVHDLSRWMLAFLRQLEDPATDAIYRQMIEPSFTAYPHIGLGFQLYDFTGTQAVGHFGGDKGFRSFLMMIPDQQIGVVVLGNCDYEEDFRQEIVHAITNWMIEE